MFFLLRREGKFLCFTKLECVYKPFVPWMNVIKTHFAMLLNQVFLFLFFPLQSLCLLFFSFLSLSLNSGTLSEVVLAIVNFVYKLCIMQCVISQLHPLNYFHSHYYCARTTWKAVRIGSGGCFSFPWGPGLGAVEGKEPWAQNQLLTVHSHHVNGRGSILHFFSEKSLKGSPKNVKILL